MSRERITAILSNPGRRRSLIAALLASVTKQFTAATSP
jgi:hypothetical protein